MVLFLRKALFLGLPATILFVCCTGHGHRIKNEVDSISYVMGVDYGFIFKDMDSTINVDIFRQGVIDYLEGAPKIELSSQEDIVKYLENYFTVVRPENNKKLAEDILADVLRTNKRARRTESGLVYEIISEGTGKKVSDDRDRVIFNYTMAFPGGRIIESSEEAKDIPLGHLIPAWQEGIGLIKGGGHIKLWSPPHLAFGEKEYYEVEPNQALVFEIKLLRVIPAVD